MKAVRIKECTTSSLRISVQPGDGLHHGVELISFSNVSGVSCRLSGYPLVEAILDSSREPGDDASIYTPAAPGTYMKAHDTQWAWAGGVDFGDTPLKTFVAPVIILTPHRGVATATLNWIDGPNGSGTCPAFNDVIIGIGGRSVTRFVRAYEPLCYEFDVTPIVEGSTGSMFVKADFSQKANDLADAKTFASSLRTEVASLHHELVHPKMFSITERMQAAESIQQSSEYILEDSPWPKLNASLKRVGQDCDSLGNNAIISLTQPGFGRAVRRDYLKLLASLKSLARVLSHVS